MPIKSTFTTKLRGNCCLFATMAMVIGCFFFLTPEASADTWMLTKREFREQTVLVDGVLVLPAPLNPADFVVANRFGAAIPNESGEFQILVQTAGATVAAAVPKDYAGGANPWVAVTVRLPGDPAVGGPQVRIDAESTARALILLHPFFATPDPYRLRAVDEILGNQNQLAPMAGEVTAVWPTNTNPFEAQQVLSVYTSLMNDTLDSLPKVGDQGVVTTPALKQGTVEAALGATTGARDIERESAPRIVSSQLDSVLQSELEIDAADAHLVRVSSSTGNPLDTLHRLVRVNPVGTHTWRRGSNSVGQFTIASREEALALRNTIGSNGRFAIFELSGDFDQGAVGSADSIYVYLDFFGQLISLITEPLGFEWGGIPNEITLPDLEDGLYVNYSFTGKMTSGFDDGEFLHVWHSHREDMVRAFCLNLMNGGLEALSLLVDLDDVIGPCAGDALNGMITEANARLNFASEDTPLEVYPLVFAVGTGGVVSLTNCAIGQVAETPMKALLTLSKSLVGLLDVFQNISTVGSFVDRATALSGFPLGPSPVSIFSTPMDTQLLIVGDPWGPRIMSVNGVEVADPGTPLQVVGLDETLTIRGQRFQPTLEAPLPTLLLHDSTGRVHVLPVQSVDVSTSHLQEVVVPVPADAAGRVRLEIRAASGFFETPEVLEVPPFFESVQTDYHYLPIGGPMVATTSHVIGRGFNPDRHSVVVGAAAIGTNAGGTSTRMAFDVPTDAAVGRHEVKVRWRSPVDDLSASPAPSYIHVLGPPTINSSTGLGTVSSGQSLVVNGVNFGRISPAVKAWIRVPGSPIPSTPSNIRAILDAGVDGTNQVSQALVAVDWLYIDPFPEIPEAEPITLEVLMETPAGLSNAAEFQLVGEGTAPYSRTLSVPAIALGDAIAFANQGDTAPAGGIQVDWVCDIEGNCGVDENGDPLPATYGRCHVNYPSSWIPQVDGLGNHIGTTGVSLPPGFPAVSGAPCNDCDVVGTNCIPAASGPISWEGITAEEIVDTIEIADDAGDVSLADLPVLRGPNVRFFHHGSANARLVGGGLIIEGDGIDDPTPRNIQLNIDVEAGEGTVITIRNCNTVSINLEINGNGADVGLLIENCRRINGVATIRGCAHAVEIRNSFECEIETNISGYVDGLIVDGGGQHRLSGDIGWRMEAPLGAFVEEGQKIGVHLKGNTIDNQLIGMQVVGNEAAGILVDLAQRTQIRPGIIGAIPRSAPEAITPHGQSTSNAIGVWFRSGAVGSHLQGRHNDCGEYALNQGNSGGIMANVVGIRFDGGTNNIICGVEFGFDETRVDLANGTGVLMEGRFALSPQGNILHGNQFWIPASAGIRLDTVNRSNTISANRFDGIPHTGEGPTPIGLQLMNGSSKLLFQNNRMDNVPIGVEISGSDNLEFQNNVYTRSQLVAFQASDAQALVLSGERICGAVYNASGDSCLGNAAGGDGLRLDACSDVSISDYRVEAMGGDGIDILSPPEEAGGAIRLVSPLVDGGTHVPPPTRDALFNALNPLPTTRRTGAKVVTSRRNGGNGLIIRDGATEVSLAGLSIVANTLNGILIDSPGKNISITESAITDNLEDGIRINGAVAASLRIGAGKKGNLIGANRGWGLNMQDSDSLVFQGNYVVFNGTNSGDTNGGIRLVNSTDVLIGGSDFNMANLISANRSDGILLSQIPTGQSTVPSYRIEGNFVGTTNAGTAALGNAAAGIHLMGWGTNPLAQLYVMNNLVSSNGTDGILISGWNSQTGPIVIGNLIGKDPDSTLGLPNQQSGIRIQESSKTLIRGNRIDENLGDGIILEASSNNLLIANEIIGNGDHGIRLAAGSSGNIVQRSATISANGGNGILVDAGSVENTLTTNSIHENADSAIRLVASGNQGIPPPTITGKGMTSLGRPIYTGRVDPAIPDYSLVELFAEDGRVYLASAIVQKSQFAFPGVRVPPDVVMSDGGMAATVTDPRGNTSEFGIFDPNGTGRHDGDPAGSPSLIVLSERVGNIASTNVGTGETALLTNGADHDDQPVGLDATGVGSFLFARGAEGAREIIHFDGSNFVNLTDAPSDDYHPSLSPDGQKVAFVSNRSGSPDVYTMDMNGENVTRITTHLGAEQRPIWINDGITLLFESDADGSFQLYTIDQAGESEVIKVTSLPGSINHPSWNPATGLVALEQCDAPGQLPGQCRIGLLDIQSQSVRWIPNGTWSDMHPHWMADGDASYLVISSKNLDVPGSNPHLYLMSEEGYVLWRISPEGATDREPGS